MASAFTHALVGASIGLVAAVRLNAPEPAQPHPDFGDRVRRSRRLRLRLVVVSAALSVAPDLDVAMHAFVEYSHPFGHRGAFHSVAAALLFGALCALAFARERLLVLATSFASYLSHSLLDMMTDGGLGVALFWPLSGDRWFFPFRPIPVSPLRLSAFFSERGLRILAHELPFAIPPLLLAVAFHLLASRSAR